MLLFFFQKANNNYAGSRVLEKRGIYIRTSRMQSERSTIRANSTMC